MFHLPGTVLNNRRLDQVYYIYFNISVLYLNTVKCSV